MATTSNTYTVGSSSGGYGGSVAGPYPYSFPILADTDIRVSVDAIIKSLTTHYTVDSQNSRITFVSGQEPSNAQKVIVYRKTAEDPINATFVSGSTIRSQELNDNFTQLLYVVQESEDQAMSTLGGTMQSNFNLGVGSGLVFEGSTDNDNETTLTVDNPTADRTITLPNVTGTVLTTGSTAAVTNAMLAADAVNGAKIADDSINSEHVVDGSIDRVHLAADIIDSTKLADDAVDSEHIGDGAINGTAMLADSVVTTAKIADDAITSAKIADNAITNAMMADDAITAAEIAANAVGASELANNSVSTEHIQDGNVTGVKIGADAIDATKIADNSISTEHIQDNNVTTAKIADAELKTLAGMQSGTASILADSTALTATTAEINSVVDGKAPQTTISDDDTKYPTSGAVVDYVAAQLAPIGGLEVIATEVAFPNTQPAAGVVISIADAGGVVVNGSGVSTTGRTVGGSTVTINGINSAFYSKTVDAGVAFMVSSTGSGQIYDFHKATLKEADILNLSNDINDFGNRYRVASSAPSSDNDEGDMYFDTSANKMYVYDGSAWGQVTSTGDYIFLELKDTDGSAPTYNGASEKSYNLVVRGTSTAASITNAAQLLISVNGVIQKANNSTVSASDEGFSLTDADTIKFATAPASGSSVFVTQTGSATTIGTPNDNTVATAKLQNLAVTNDKIANDTIKEVKLDVSNAPSNGQYLQYKDSTDELTWATVSTDLVSDTSPELGGTLDMGSNTIQGDGGGTGKTHISSTQGFFPGGYGHYSADGATGWKFHSSGHARCRADGSNNDGLGINAIQIGNFSGADDALTIDGAGNLTTSGAVVSNDLRVQGAEGSHGAFQIWADEGDDNADKWKFLAHTGGDFQIQNYTSGSWENSISATGNGSVRLCYDGTEEFTTTSGGVKCNGYSESVVFAGGSINSNPTINFNEANHFSYTLTGNITFLNPTTEHIGQSGTITITQDGTGSRTAAWQDQFKWIGGTAPTLSTAANAVDRIDYIVVADGKIHCVASLDVK